MSNFLFIVLGLLSGVAGGMGMGGGTILIPLVTLFLNVAQKEAQFLNIFSFIIMASIVIFFHIKNKLVDVYPAVMFSVFGVGSAICSALLVKQVENSVLRIMFGIFLIILSIIQFVAYLIKKNQKR